MHEAPSGGGNGCARCWPVRGSSESQLPCRTLGSRPQSPGPALGWAVFTVGAVGAPSEACPAGAAAPWASPHRVTVSVLRQRLWAVGAQSRSPGEAQRRVCSAVRAPARASGAKVRRGFGGGTSRSSEAQCAGPRSGHGDSGQPRTLAWGALVSEVSVDKAEAGGRGPGCFGTRDPFLGFCAQEHEARWSRGQMPHGTTRTLGRRGSGSATSVIPGMCGDRESQFEAQVTLRFPVTSVPPPRGGPSCLKPVRRTTAVYKQQFFPNGEQGWCRHRPDRGPKSHRFRCWASSCNTI